MATTEPLPQRPKTHKTKQTREFYKNQLQQHVQIQEQSQQPPNSGNTLQVQSQNNQFNMNSHVSLNPTQITQISSTNDLLQFQIKDDQRSPKSIKQKQHRLPLLHQKPVYIAKKLDPLKGKFPKKTHVQQQPMENIDELSSPSKNITHQNSMDDNDDNLNSLDHSGTKFSKKSKSCNKNSQKNQIHKIPLQEKQTSQKKIPNMFEGAKMYGQIPLIKPDGSLPRHKIVGKPEWFIKHHQINLQRKENNTSYPDDASTPSMRSGYPIRTQRSQTFAHRQKTAQMHNKQLKTRQNEGEKIDKMQLTSEIKGIFERLADNRRASQEFKEILAKDQSNITELNQNEKEQRILRAFNRQQGVWKQQIARSTSRTRRKYEDSIIFETDAHRAKVETMKALDLLKSDNERYGTRFWQMSLRSSKDYKKDEEVVNQDPSDTFIDDFPVGFSTFQAPNKNKELEVIRKTEGNKLKSKYEGTSMFSTFKSDQYFKKKFADQPKEKIDQILHLDDKEFKQLEVEGTSKLHNEIISLLNDETTYFLKKKQNLLGGDEKLKSIEQQDNEEEILEINYDRKNLTKMPGYSFNKFRIKY